MKASLRSASALISFNLTSRPRRAERSCPNPFEIWRLVPGRQMCEEKYDGYNVEARGQDVLVHAQHR
jgi:hypothetical protein